MRWKKVNETKLVFPQKQVKKVLKTSLSQILQTRKFISLRKTQWLSYQKLRNIQQKKVQAIIKYAYHNVEYYHNLFKSLNLSPNEIKTIDDLNKIPILTKSKIQNESQKIIAYTKDRNQCISSTTSGSSGKPLTIFFDKNAINNIKSRYLRQYFESGGHPRYKIVHFTNPNRFGQKRLVQNLGFLSKKHLSVLDKTSNQIRNLLEVSPDVIEGYPSILWLIANAIDDNNITGINPKLVFSSAELLLQNVRKKINSTFNVEMFDQYGAAEFGTFAWECPEHNGYHMDIESVVVEFVRDGEPVSPEEKGEIVVTGLFNSAMPLIRYSIGDIGSCSLERCCCGRNLPLMKIVEGRTDDFVILPSGNIISPRHINFLENVEGIKSYRIIQKKQNELLVQITKDTGFSEKTIPQAKNEILNGCLGEDLGIFVEIVDEIPRDKSGKIRAVISELNKPITSPHSLLLSQFESSRGE